MAEYVVVDKEKLESDLTSVADSIRAKANVTEKLEFPSEYKSVVESIDTSKPEQEKTISITENGTTEVTPDEGKVLSKVTVNVEVASDGGSGEEFVGIKYLETNEYNLPTIIDASSLLPAMSGRGNSYSNLFKNTDPNPNAGGYGYTHTIYTPSFEGSFTVSQYMFQNCIALTNLIGDFSPVKYVGAFAFGGCRSLTEAPYMPNIINTETNAFQNCTGLTRFKFYSTPTGTINANTFNGCTNLRDIYVPWAEGTVANAPWGATNATIHYNTVYDENHNPIV